MVRRVIRVRRDAPLGGPAAPLPDASSDGLAHTAVTWLQDGCRCRIVNDTLEKTSTDDTSELARQNELQTIAQLNRLPGNNQRADIFRSRLLQPLDTDVPSQSIFAIPTGYVRLPDIPQAALEPQHVGWMLKRVMELLLVLDSEQPSYAHGGMTPDVFWVQPLTHGVAVSGWGLSRRDGQPLTQIRAGYERWYPSEVFARQSPTYSTDLVVAIRSFIWAAGGDPLSGKLPNCPARFQDWIDGCLLPSRAARNVAAAAVYYALSRALTATFGHGFVPMSIRPAS